MSDLAAKLLRVHIDEPKDARETTASWRRSPSGAELRLKFSVHRADTTMTVLGVFRSAADQQLILTHPGYGHGRQHLRRLCLTPIHHGGLHWHELEGHPTEARTIPVPLGAWDLADPGTLLMEVFVPKLRISGLVYEGRLDV